MTSEHGSTRHKQEFRRAAMTRGTRAVLLASIPVYVLLTTALALWLPEYALLALIPIAFASHSAAVLLRGMEP